MKSLQKQNNKRITESGNAVIIVLIALVVVAVGAIAYLSGQMAGEQIQTQTGDQVAENNENGIANPVVAKVNGEDIQRQEVFNVMGVLSENLRGQIPGDQLYVMALEQTINSKIIEKKVENSKIGRDPEVKEQLQKAREQIERTVFLQKEAQNRITDEQLQNAYNAYKENFPKIEEVNAKQILVADEGKAKELIKQIEEGAAFEELAEKNSISGSPLPGGELGYFKKDDVVPEFGEAAFKMKPGEHSKTPTRSKYGYHIIKVLDKRMRPPEEFEQAKPFLEATLRRQLLDEAVKEWREEATIVRFDVNGKPLEPAAGEGAKIVPTVQEPKNEEAKEPAAETSAAETQSTPEADASEEESAE